MSTIKEEALSTIAGDALTTIAGGALTTIAGVALTTIAGGALTTIEEDACGWTCTWRGSAALLWQMSFIIIVIILLLLLLSLYYYYYYHYYYYYYYYHYYYYYNYNYNYYYLDDSLIFQNINISKKISTDFSDNHWLQYHRGECRGECTSFLLKRSWTHYCANVEDYLLQLSKALQKNSFWHGYKA